MQRDNVEDLAEACGEGERIIAFVQDTAEIKKIMHALGLPDPPSASFRRGLLGSSANRLSPDEALGAKSDYTAAPPIPCPSNFEEHLFVDDMPDYD